MSEVRRCLVTHGAGFIGGWWVRHLRRRSHSVIAVDAPFARDLTAVPRDVELVASRLLDMEEVERLVDRVDTVFHLACDPLPQAAGLRRAAWSAASVKAGLGLIEACAARKRELVLVTPGDAVGRAVESLALAWHREDGAPFKIARVRGSFGPNQPPEPENAVAHLMARALSGKPLVVSARPGERLSYVYIEDALAALELIWRKGAPGKVYDVGSGEEVSAERLAQAVLEAAGSSSPVVFDPKAAPGPDEPFAPGEDHARAAQSLASPGELGYRPAYDLESALRKTAASMKAMRRPEERESRGGQGI